MRTANSIKNISVAMASYILAMLAGIVSQSILVRYLGIEYNGINGLFSNVVSMLAIAELGIGSAVVYHLYKPIAEKNKEKIKSLMNFYKIAYRIIAIVIGIIGIMIFPFLGTIVGETTIQNKEIYIIFSLFLFDTICSYLLTYKRSLLYADQKNYIINLVHILYIIFLNAIQIAIIIVTKNYILYLVVKIIFRILENVIITVITNKRYPYILEKNTEKLEKNIFQDIMQKVKALLFHKVGGYISGGTENIVISMFLGISTVGIYTNYKIILNAISTLISQIFNALTASVGNLLVVEGKDKVFEIYKRLSVLNFFIYYISSTVLYGTISIMVKILYGEQYIIPIVTVGLIIANFFIQGLKKTIQLFKEAACIFYEDRYIPMLEAIINIIISVILVQIIGLNGIFIAAMISSLIIFLYSYPKYVYQKILKREKKYYILEQSKYVIIFLITIIILTLVLELINIENAILNLIVATIISLCISFIIFIVIYIKTDEFKYYKEFIFKFIKNKGKITN